MLCENPKNIKREFQLEDVRSTKLETSVDLLSIGTSDTVAVLTRVQSSYQSLDMVSTYTGP